MKLSVPQWAWAMFPARALDSCVAAVLIAADKEHSHHCGKFYRLRCSESGVRLGCWLLSGGSSLYLPKSRFMLGSEQLHKTHKEGTVGGPSSSEGFLLGLGADTCKAAEQSPSMRQEAEGTFSPRAGWWGQGGEASESGSCWSTPAFSRGGSSLNICRMPGEPRPPSSRPFPVCQVSLPAAAVSSWDPSCGPGGCFLPLC